MKHWVQSPSVGSVTGKKCNVIYKAILCLNQVTMRISFISPIYTSFVITVFFIKVQIPTTSSPTLVPHRAVFSAPSSTPWTLTTAIAHHPSLPNTNMLMTLQLDYATKTIPSQHIRTHFCSFHSGVRTVTSK